MTQDIDVGKLAEQINDKADRDLWNTVPNVWNNTLNTSQITNCITEIPQDIKLELNDGVLTLKAGSKVYMPNGVGVFDKVVITQDKSINQTVNGVWMCFVNESGNLQRWNMKDCFSGTTAPTSVTYPMWYDTTNNIIKVSDNYGSTWTGKFSLPIAIYTATNGAISSIDQVFNGFGYIGSTVFALPGVKGLIPNGRNTDGSLKNIEFTVDEVITRTITWNNAAGQELFIGKYNLNEGLKFISTGKIGQYYIQDAEPAKIIYAHWYKPTENKVYRCNKDSNGNLIWKDNFPCYIGQWFTSATSPYPIIELTTKLPFRAVDWNDFQQLASNVYSAGNIGDIKYTSRTDVPNGGAWCDGAVYTKAQFPDVYQMLVDGKLQSTTVSEFDSSVSTNGSCGFFGLDTANERFKVPMLKDVYIKAGQAPSMFGAESLPNIKGAIQYVAYTSSPTGAFKLETPQYVAGPSSWTTNDSGGRTTSFDASRSSSTYQDGAKVNPDHVTYRAYVVLYASAAEASVAQAAEFMTALGGKANADMDNLSATGRNTLLSGVAPSSRNISVSLQPQAYFQAPANGYIHIGIDVTDAYGQVLIYAEGDNDKTTPIFNSGIPRTTPSTARGMFYIGKGQIFRYNSSVTAKNINFRYALGEK